MIHQQHCNTVQAHRRALEHNFITDPKLVAPPRMREDAEIALQYVQRALYAHVSGTIVEQ